MITTSHAVGIRGPSQDHGFNYRDVTLRKLHCDLLFEYHFKLNLLYMYDAIDTHYHGDCGN